MDFALTDEQRARGRDHERSWSASSTRTRQRSSAPGCSGPSSPSRSRTKAIKAGLHAANMPEEVGGAGLDTVTWVLFEKELGKASYALHSCIGRPSNILLAGTEAQKERYLYPSVRGERRDCLAMTEPDAGSDLRGMRTRAVRDGDGWRIKGTKHFISHAQESDFVILFAVTDGAGRRPEVDVDVPGRPRHPGARPCTTATATCRTAATPTRSSTSTTATCPPTRCWARRARASTWPAPGWAAPGSRWPRRCLGRAERALDLAVHHAADREQFGQKIGRFQGISFKLADMAMELRAAELLTLRGGLEVRPRRAPTDADIAMAKLKATEVLAMVADEAIQIHGGMGLMDELPLERIWRDARIERIWDGTSEIQRHIISRALLRPLGA